MLGVPAGIVPQLGRRGRPPRRRRVFAVPVEFDHAAERQLAQESVCVRDQLLRRAGERMLKRENMQEPATTIICIAFHSALARRKSAPPAFEILLEHTETRAYWGVARWSPAVLVPILSRSMPACLLVTIMSKLRSGRLSAAKPIGACDRLLECIGARLPPSA